jgi:hypothetical protein
MRAATVIVGATAFSSCLIALALLLSASGGSSEQDTQTARSSTRQAVETGGSGGSVEAKTVPKGVLKQCGSREPSISVEGVSCVVGEEVHRTYQNQSRGTFAATDPETGKNITVKCRGTAPVICSGADGVSIYFAPEG